MQDEKRLEAFKDFTGVVEGWSVLAMRVPADPPFTEEEETELHGAAADLWTRFHVEVLSGNRTVWGRFNLPTRGAVVVYLYAVWLGAEGRRVN